MDTTYQDHILPICNKCIDLFDIVVDMKLQLISMYRIMQRKNKQIA